MVVHYILYILKQIKVITMIYFAKDEELCFDQPRLYKWLWGATKQDADTTQEELGEEWVKIPKTKAVERFGAGAVKWLDGEIMNTNFCRG